MTVQPASLPAERDLAASATGLLRDFNAYGVLTWADVHPAIHLCHLYGERDDRVRLAVALTVRALRAGSLCVDLAAVRDEAGRWEPAEESEDAAETVPVVPPDAWPEPAAWLAAVAASGVVTVGRAETGRGGPDARPLRLVDGLLYLERYWQDQETVRRHVEDRLRMPAAPLAGAVPDAPADPRYAAQHRALTTALDRRLTVIAGGPGTGKTRVIGDLVSAFGADGRRLLVGLAAPTGKAAARMSDSMRERDDVEIGPGAAASTLHRLLGSLPGTRSRFRHDATNPLPHDVVIVDELSMVSMTLMARLLEALKPDARLVLVGDPDQLASVEAGAVLADLTASAATAPAVVRLDHNFRFEGAIQALADAIRDGDADGALAVLRGPDARVRLLPAEEAEDPLRRRCTGAGDRLFAAAASGDAKSALTAMDAHRLLCAHRRGRFGVQQWQRTVTSWLTEDVPGYSTEAEFYVGRPLMMTANAADLELYNGDTGVVLGGSGPAEAVFNTGTGERRFSPYLLDGLVSVHAMTIHKSQGSQFDEVSVVLPPVGSPLLTRELLYTAVTRARQGVLLVGDEDAVRAAIERPGARTSGLRALLDADASA